MGSDVEDSGRRISALRGDVSDAIAELQDRIRGSASPGDLAGARGAGAQAGQQLGGRVREKPQLAAVAGMVAVGAAGYGLYALADRWRESRLPQNRLKRRVGGVRTGVESGVRSRVTESRRRVEKAKKTARNAGLLLKLDPQGKGYVRVTDAKLDIPNRKKDASNVLKKLIWAVFLSALTAGASVLAKRLAGQLWQSTMHEEPPDQKEKK